MIKQTILSIQIQQNGFTIYPKDYDKLCLYFLIGHKFFKFRMINNFKNLNKNMTQVSSKWVYSNQMH